MTFKSDFRATKPSLHRLYVSFAMQVLGEIDRAIKRFQGMAKVDASTIAGALWQERDKLIKHDAAYAEADELIKVLRTGKLPDPTIETLDT